MNATTKQAQTQAVKVLLYYSVLFTEKDALCGHCGESATPIHDPFCKTCAVTWRFAAVTFESPLSMDAQAKIFDELLPQSLSFIGRVDAMGVHEAYLPLGFG